MNQAQSQVNWLKQATETAQAAQAVNPGQPVTISITIDNSYRDNRVVHIHHHTAPTALPYQSQVGVCAPNRFHLTSGFDSQGRYVGHEGDAPNNERRRWINAAEYY